MKNDLNKSHDLMRHLKYSDNQGNLRREICMIQLYYIFSCLHVHHSCPHNIEWSAKIVLPLM